VTEKVKFPSIAARDLEGRDVHLPEEFDGVRNVAIIAFQRSHQSLVDSWLPLLEELSAGDSELRFYELPTIGRIWAPARKMIDGGMAAAIRDPVVLRRTLTIYGDISRVTSPLDIKDRSTIALVVVDREGVVTWSGVGPYSEDTADSLREALAHS
jgi:hypothetical protein